LQSAHATTILKYTSNFVGTASHLDEVVVHVEPLVAHQDAAMANGAKISEATGGDTKAISEYINAAPEYLGLGDHIKPLAVGNGGRTVAYFNTETNEITIAFGGTSNKDLGTAMNDWGIHQSGELGTNAQIANGTLAETQAFKDNLKFVEEIEAMGLTDKPFRYTGHSQGGSMAIEMSKIKPTGGANVFNPGIAPSGTGLHPEAGKVTVYRTHTDPVSAMGVAEGGENISVVNVGLKTGSKGEKAGHELSQFLHPNEAVNVTEEGVEVVRMGKAASFGRVAGTAFAVCAGVAEAGYDASTYDGDIGEKTAVAVADAGVAVAEFAAFDALAGVAVATGPVGVAVMGTAMVIDALVHDDLKKEAQEVTLAVEHGVEKAGKAVGKAVKKGAKKVASAFKHFFHW